MEKNKEEIKIWEIASFDMMRK